MEGWSEGGTQQQQERWQSRTWDPENRLDSSYQGISNLCPTILCYTQPNLELSLLSLKRVQKY